MLDCCGKPSRDMGDQTRFENMSRKLSEKFAKLGVEEIIVACPNCRSVLLKNSGVRVSTVYEIMAREGLPGGARNNSHYTEWVAQNRLPCSGLEAESMPAASVTIHDSCPARYAPSVRGAVRDVADQMGLRVDEIKFKNGSTKCCGAGGCAAMGNTALADRNAKARAEQANSLVVTYCANCRERLSSYVPAVHILDIVFESGYQRPTREYRDGWQNWLNRWILKKKLQLRRLRNIASPDSSP